MTAPSARSAAPVKRLPAWVSRDGFDAFALILPSGRQAPRPPKAAVELADAARAAGWTRLPRWCEDCAGAPFLSAELGITEPFHYYWLCWHSRPQLAPAELGEEITHDASTARPQLFTKLLTTTSGPASNAPSVKTIANRLARSAGAQPSTAAARMPATVTSATASDVASAPSVGGTS